MRLGLQLGLGAGLPVRNYFDAGSTASAVTGLLTLPSWMAITCATTGRSTRTSATTVKTGLGANAARMRNVGGATGLSVEAASTIVMPAPSDFSSADWTKQAGVVVTTNQAVAPDGLATADLLAITNANTGVFPASGTVVDTTIYSASVWLRMATGTGSVTLANAQATVLIPSFSLTTDWQLCDFAEAAPGTALGAPWIRKVTGSNFYAWGAQYGTGKIPGSFMNGSGTRAADVLTVATPSTIAPGGFFQVDMAIAPNYTQAEQAADHNLVYFDANNRLYIKQSSHTIILRIGGVDLASAALTWSREAPLRIRAKHTSAGRELIVEGATTGNGGSGLQSASAAISLPGAAYLLGTSLGAEESADLQSFVAYEAT